MSFRVESFIEVLLFLCFMYFFRLPGKLNKTYERRIEMSVMESILSAVFCMAVVFVVLICLYFLIKLFSVGIRKIEMNGKKSTE